MLFPKIDLLILPPVTLSFCFVFYIMTFIFVINFSFKHMLDLKLHKILFTKHFSDKNHLVYI